MNTKTNIKVSSLILGVLGSPVALAAMDCSDPMHAQMAACKATAMDHSKMDHSKMAMPAKKMDHSKMDHSKMTMPGMDHSKMNKPSIPVSDGSAATDIPYLFKKPKMEDDPILTMFKVGGLEILDAEGSNPITWEAEAWIGKDINKLWFKTEGERVDGVTEEFELQALYSRAIDPYWDLQVGLRKDFKPKSRNWAVAGFKGVAPYYFETDAAVFVGESGRTALRLKSEYELMLSQKLVLSPEIELNLYGKDDPELGIGSGLSNGSLGLRLRYEINRQFAPYIGVKYASKFGKTADFARDEGEDVSDTKLLLGISAWF